MLEASQPSCSAATRNRLIAAHRAGGYLFVVLLSIMACSMSQRLVGVGISGRLPTHLVLHIVFVTILVTCALPEDIDCTPLPCKQRHSSREALGIAIFVSSFAVVSIPTLSQLLRSANP
jgi:hypothetical protein